MRRSSFISTLRPWQNRQLGKGAGAPQGGIQTAEITVTNIQIARLLSQEPTTVFSSQDEFTCTSYEDDAYHEATILKVLNWPGALSGKTITAVSLTLYHNITGYAAATSTLSVRNVLRTVVMAQVTATVYSTGNSWQTLMAAGALDVNTSATLTTVTMPADSSAGSLICPSSAGFVTLVQDQKDGLAANNGYLLHPSFFADYHSFSGPTGANPPVMNITYNL